jgi:hypothetical protein
MERDNRPTSNIPASGQCFDLLIIEKHVREDTTTATIASKTVVARPGSIVLVGRLQRPFIFRPIRAMRTWGLKVEEKLLNGTVKIFHEVLSRT